MSRTEVYWYLKEKQFLKLLWSWTCGATWVIDYYEKKKVQRDAKDTSWPNKEVQVS